MRIPARCNKRACQARRNLSKYPQEYRRWPQCHVPGCGGRMYVDKYRLEKLDVRHSRVCYDDCYPYPHNEMSPECKKREEALLERSLQPRPKHSPVPEQQECDF